MEYIDHSFSMELAKDYDVNTAIFLQNIFFWAYKNKANKKNLFEGRYWTYNSMDGFCAIHPYWSRRQIERIVAKCKEAGLLLVGCFNESKIDRTSWYTLTEKAVRYFSDDPTILAECISPNGEMHITESGDAYHQTVEPIPDIKQDINQDNTPQTPQGAERAENKRKSKHDLAEDAKPILRAYCTNYPELAHPLADLIEIRRAKEAINSKRAIVTLLNELDRLSDGRREDKLLIIRQSIVNSWKSVYPLSRSTGAHDVQPTAPLTPPKVGWDYG